MLALPLVLLVPLLPVATANHVWVPDTLPQNRTGTSAIFADNGFAYVFGGFGCPNDCSGILRYDPASGSVVTVASLPSGRHFTSAAFDGSRFAYVFGGNDCVGPCGAKYNQIVRFDTDTNAVTVLGSTLPSARGFTAAVFINSKAYVFGGLDSTGTRLGSIVEFNPANGAVVTKGAVLHQNMYGVAAVATGSGAGSIARLYGGNGHLAGGPTTLVQTYDPATDTRTTFLGEAMPTALSLAAAGWESAEGVAYIFGGQTGGGPSTATILRHVPGVPPGAIGPTLPSARETHSAATDTRKPTPAFLLFGGIGVNQIVRFAPNNDAPSAGIAFIADPFECNASGGAVVALSSLSTDPDPGEVLLHAWTGTGSIVSPTSPSTTGTFGFGGQSVTLSVDDQEDHTSSTSRSFTVQDTTGPVTTPTLLGTGGPVWFRSSVTVTLSASDACGGATSTQLSVDGGPFAPGTSVTVGTEGPHTVSFFSTDARGNVESTKSVSFSIDLGAPNVDLTEPAPGTLYTFDAAQPVPVPIATIVGGKTLRATATDALSGVARVDFLRDGVLLGSDNAAPYQFFWNPALTEVGLHTLTARAVDVAGNTADDNVQVLVVDV